MRAYGPFPRYSHTLREIYTRKKIIITVVTIKWRKMEANTSLMMDGFLSADDKLSPNGLCYGAGARLL